MRALIVGLSVSALLGVAPALGHHGGGIEWQTAVEGPLTGTATKFDFLFPHVVIYMDVDGESGIENWAVTTRWTPTILRQHGWSRGSIKPGDTLVVTYAPHVTLPKVVQMRTIEVNGTPLALDF